MDETKPLNKAREMARNVAKQIKYPDQYAIMVNNHNRAIEKGNSKKGLTGTGQ